MSRWKQRKRLWRLRLTYWRELYATIGHLYEPMPSWTPVVPRRLPKCVRRRWKRSERWELREAAMWVR